jgi:hypothetical protein
LRIRMPTREPHPQEPHDAGCIATKPSVFKQQFPDWRLLDRNRL